MPLLAGCDGVQSMLAPAGPGAASVAQVWWVMFAGALLVLGLVVVLALRAVYRHPEPRRSQPAGRLGDRFIVLGGVLLPTLSLTALLVYGLTAGAPPAPPGQAEPLRIEVVGHRWWWEVRYPGATPAVTANEIHIPVGRPVEVTLRSADVIHSFWVPRLAGKLDVIPGHDNVLSLRADEAGAFRGQCAEFCGAQHAHMAFWVVAEPAAQFAQWLERQRRPAREPVTAAERRGQQAFLAGRCVECHTIRGTVADGHVGPDLTHVGGRRTLAAGTLPAGRANLARWIVDNQRIKPGNRMLDFSHLEPATTEAIATYLEGLR
jgi:cytochrome c oxidase subunit 2